MEWKRVESLTIYSIEEDGEEYGKRINKSER